MGDDGPVELVINELVRWLESVEPLLLDALSIGVGPRYLEFRPEGVVWA